MRFGRVIIVTAMGLIHIVAESLWLANELETLQAFYASSILFLRPLGEEIKS
jgi:hypothetical protein